jgi:hypothetical protein
MCGETGLKLAEVQGHLVLAARRWPNVFDLFPQSMHPTDYRIISATDPALFDYAAMIAAKKSTRFTDSMEGGAAVAGRREHIILRRIFVCDDE